jgi:hypothetical protein
MSGIETCLWFAVAPQAHPYGQPGRRMWKNASGVTSM